MTVKQYPSNLYPDSVTTSVDFASHVSVEPVIVMARELLALRAGRDIPEGWKLVPEEPTKQMLEASYREASVYSPTAYRAMLAAAPIPPE